MLYVSTRDVTKKGVCSAYAIKEGLAPDGGLYIPEYIPTLSLDMLLELSALSYPERAAKILSLFLTDFTYEELLADTTDAYSSAKFTPSPAPLSHYSENKYILELWHGPTCAFKDMALQLMPRLFVRALRKCNESRTALILVATSGDTGKAALEGYKNVEGTAVKVFYPTDGVSRVQKLQMQTQDGTNLSVDAIEGNFDDAQSGVKMIFSDEKFKTLLNDKNVFLSSANSINWGRLVPQIVYYVSAYVDLYNLGAIKLGDEIDFSVPTGNFGNIFAAHIARLMGLPVGTLICASNSNNVLTDFFNTGIYDKNRPFRKTVSPSMDILISSNLERLISITLGQSACADYMAKLAKDGKYQLTEEHFAKVTSGFKAYYATEEQTALTVRESFENKNCLIDTHTAVALYATEKYMSESKAERKTVTVSTASAYKFAKDVYESISGKEAESLEALKLLEALSGVSIPAPLADLQSRALIHTRIIAKDDMKSAVERFACN